MPTTNKIVVYHHGSMCYDGSMVEHEGSNDKPLSVQLPAVRAYVDQASGATARPLPELQTAAMGHDSPEAPEEWREVVGTDGAYEVSSLGRLRSYKRKGAGNKTRKTVPVVLTPSHDRKGYLMHQVSYPTGNPNRCSLAKLVAEAFIGPRPPGLHVAHINGNKRDNRPENLKYCTAQENNLDRIVHHTMPCGPMHHQSKMTWKKVAELRRLYAQGESFSALGRIFGLHYTSAQAIALRRTWIPIEERADRALATIAKLHA